MAFRLNDIADNSPIKIYIVNKGKRLSLKGNIKKHLDKNIAVITIDYKSNQLLVFDNVQIDVEYAQNEAFPYIFKNCKNYSLSMVITPKKQGFLSLMLR